MSPIAGLTDRPGGFIQLAKVNKGEMVPEKGGVKAHPRDLDYFRLTYSDGCDDVRRAFEAMYGLKPIAIDMRMPFQTVVRCWDANYTAYDQGGLTAKAGSYKDEEGNEHLYWLYYRDHITKDVWVRDGHAVGSEGERFIKIPIDRSAPVYIARGSEEPAFLKTEGRLNFVVPGLAYVEGKPRAGYFTFVPRSPRDIGTISAEFSGIEEMAKENGVDINKIPMRLIRRKEQVTVRIENKTSRKWAWVVHVEPGGDWTQKALTVMETMGIKQLTDEAVYEDDDIVEGEQEDVEETTPEPSKPDRTVIPLKPVAGRSQQPPAPAATQPTPPPVTRYTDPTPAEQAEDGPPAEFGGAGAPVTAQPAPQAPTGELPIERPYSPAVFKAKLLEIAELLPGLYKKTGVDITVPAPIRNVLASLLDTTMEGQKDRRHVLCVWLFGKGSTKELTHAQVRALFKVMEIKYDSQHTPTFETPPSDVSRTELQSAFVAAYEYMKNPS